MADEKKKSKGETRYGKSPKVVPKEGKGDTEKSGRPEEKGTPASPAAGKESAGDNTKDAGNRPAAKAAAESTAGSPKEPAGGLPAPKATGVEGTAGAEKEIPAHEEHARERKETHSRHNREREEMNARHEDELKKMAKRHSDAAGGY